MSNKRKFYRDGKPIFLKVNNRFYNRKPIIFAHIISQLGDNSFLSEFPAIDDFDIIYRYNQNEIHFIYYSEKFGLLNYFPYWYIKEENIRDITVENVPIGTIEKPYCDVEQGGMIYIFEKRNHVYVMYSHDDNLEICQTWYKVSKDRYFDNWLEIISWFKYNNQIASDI
jgi:hypothetical protein